MIREAYFEHPLYVPLVRRAYELWGALERETGADLLRITRGIAIGGEHGELVPGVLESGRIHGIPLEVLRGTEIVRAFPTFTRADDLVAVVEPRAGYLDADACVASLLAMARRRGADVEIAEVLAWQSSVDGVRVSTQEGELHCRTLVLAAGPWMPDLLGGVPAPLSVERVLQASFEPADPAACGAEHLPVFVWEYEPRSVFYGFPALEGAVKLGLHFGKPVGSPRPARRRTLLREAEEVRGLIRRLLPAAAGPVIEASSCFYTKTPDGHFLIDRHPACDDAVIVSACSGHGFKFAPAIGEIVADLVLEGSPQADLEPFAFDRFGA